MNTESIKLVFALLPQVLSLLGELTRILGVSPTINAAFKVVGEIIDASEPSYDELVNLKNVIEQLVREGREPNEDEWAILQRRSDSAHEEIQNTVIEDDEV